MKSNIPKHPCSGKCSEFKEEQCNHCLIPSNSMELESTESDFLVGDAVVLNSPLLTKDSSEIFEIKYIYGNGEIRITNGLQGKTLTKQEVRHATVAELHAKRRLTEAEHALAEVS